MGEMSFEPDVADLGRRFLEWLKRKTPLDSPSVIRCEPISGGRSNPTWLVEVETEVLRSRRLQKYVLRWDPGSGPMAPYDMEKQFRVMKALGRTNVPVPTALWYEDDEDVIGAKFFVVDFVEASTPGRLLDRTDPGYPEKVKSYIDALANIHSVDWEGLGLEFLLAGDFRDAASRFLDAPKKFWQFIDNPEDLKLMTRARSWLEERKPTSVHPCLCHVDCSLTNYMFKGNSVAAVVDWELSGIYTPLKDLGSICTLPFRFRPQSTMKERENERLELIELYRSRTGIDLSDLPFWEAAACYFQSASLCHPLFKGFATRDYMDRLAALVAD